MMQNQPAFHVADCDELYVDFENSTPTPAAIGIPTLASLADLTFSIHHIIQIRVVIPQPNGIFLFIHTERIFRHFLFSAR